jgi:futalosine hydrolase
VVHVTSDGFPELGAEDHEQFLSVHQLRLLDENEFPFQQGVLVNDDQPDVDAIRRLPAVSGITVNTAHGRDESIAAVLRGVNPQVESMEGAAFMYACLINRVKFAQLRAVSNVVERRNRASWKIAEAVDALCATGLEILDSL